MIPDIVTAHGKNNLNYIKRMWDQKEENIETVSLGFSTDSAGYGCPLDEIIKLWHESTPSEPFCKINTDEMLFFI